MSLRPHSPSAPSLSPFFFRGSLVLAATLAVVLLFFFFFQRPYYSVDSIHNCVDLDRSSYGITPSVFSSLPPAPKCFVSAVELYRHRVMTDLSFFDSSYYLQPEFFPSFETIGLSAWTSPVDTHYGAVGSGSYPSVATSSILSSPSSVHPFLVYSGFGIRSLQRMTLVARLENPSDAEFVSFSLDDSSRTGFLLGPTFPKFSSDWVHRSELRVLRLTDALPHPVIILVSTAPSSASLSDPRTSQLPYFDSVEFVGEKTVFRLTLTP